jgi:hypothetical protein
MKYVAVIFFVVVLPIKCFSQDSNKYPLEFGDVFVLKAKIHKDVKQDKCPCLKDRCLLKEVDIIQTVYCPPNNTFDSIQLTKLKFILFRGKDVKTMQTTNDTLLITARPSESRYYLSFSKILPNEALKNKFYHPYGYLSELTPCKRKDKFESYILSAKE